MSAFIALPLIQVLCAGGACAIELSTAIGSSAAESCLDDSEEPRIPSIDAMAASGRRKYAKFIAGYVNHEDKSLATSAVRALGNLTAIEYEDVLIEALNKGLSHKVDLKAGIWQFPAGNYFEALVKMGSTKSIPTIRKYLDNKYSATGAIRALAQLSAVECADDLANILDGTGDNFTKETAIWALGVMGQKQYSDKIAGILNDGKSPYVLIYHSIIALANLGAREHAKSIAIYISIDSRHCGTASLAIAKMGVTDYLDEIREVVDHPEGGGEAVLALAILGDKDISKLAMNTIQNGVFARSTECAIEALGLTGEKGNAVFISNKLTADSKRDNITFYSSSIRCSLKALGALKAEGYSDLISRFLESPDPTVRATAIGALKQAGAVNKYKAKIQELTDDSSYCIPLSWWLAETKHRTVSEAAKSALAD